MSGEVILEGDPESEMSPEKRRNPNKLGGQTRKTYEGDDSKKRSVSEYINN